MPGQIFHVEKKFCLYIIFTILLFSTALISCDTTELELIKPKKAWTFLFYNDADFNNALDPLPSFYQSMKSNAQLDVVILHDREDDEARIYYITENHKLDTLAEKGELDMGDWRTLSDFIKYSKREFPAERYIIAFYDHGGGWAGACIDISNNNSLTMNEMKRAFTESGGIDIILYTAPCLMGSIESVYELRSCTDLYIGSENTSGYCYWQRMMGRICTELSINPNITNFDLSKFIINTIYDKSKNSTEWCPSNNFTMSAMSTEKIADLAMAVDELSNYLLTNIDEEWDLINDLKLKFEIFYDDYMDLYSFAEIISFNTGDNVLKTKAENIKTLISEVVIAYCKGIDFEFARGMNIYFPFTNNTSYNSYYESSDCGLDFASDTSWDEFLRALYNNDPSKINNTFPNLIYSHELNLNNLQYTTKEN